MSVVLNINTPPGSLLRLTAPLPLSDGQTLPPGLYLLRERTEEGVTLILEDDATDEPNVCWLNLAEEVEVTVPASLWTHFQDTGLRRPV